MPDAAAVGTVVLATLAAGRQRYLAERRQRAAELAELVRRAARLDRAAGRRDRGRAGRIARRLQLDGISVTERRVRQILSEMTDTVSTSAA